MTKQELEEQIKQIDKDLFNIEKARRMNGKSKTKLIAASVLLFVFIVTVCLFGG